MNKTSFRKFLGPLFGLMLFLISFWIIHHELQTYHLKDIIHSFKTIPFHYVLSAILLTALSYMIMTGYDVLAMKYIRHSLEYGRIALASFIGYAFSNNMGFAMLAGGSVRYRIYSAWGFSILEITKVIFFASLTLWTGFLTVGGLVFVFEPMVIPKAMHLPFFPLRSLGILFLFVTGGMLACAFWIKKPVRIKDWEFAVPSAGLFSAQIILSSLDWTIAGSVLYILLPGSLPLSFPIFLGIFMLAQTAGLMSQIPGGIGVFETAVILMLSPYMPASNIFGALLAYRGIYYILPLLMATLLLGAHEALRKGKGIQKTARFIDRWIAVIVPHILSFSIFIGGVILLFSGALPGATGRLKWLGELFPLPIQELSHFIGSLAGIGLIVLARGLQRRLDAAYVLTIIFLYFGIAASLLKGLDVEEAVILSIILFALLPSRRHFYRKASLFSEYYSFGWITAIILTLLCAVWLGIFAYKHVEYSSDLWWRFTIFGAASRFMRTTVGVVAISLVFALAKLLSPSFPKPHSADQKDMETSVPIVKNSPRASANLAFLGDKRFLFNQQENAFIMYGIEGRSWVSMGDPVGIADEWPELIWEFREMCDRYDGWPVFYEVRHDHLHLYLDLGLNLIKLGEEARIRLNTFSLDGSERKGLRYTSRKLEKEGCFFDYVASKDIPFLLPELKKISDTWLAEKSTREKGFSLGFFDAGYLSRFPVGIVRKNGTIVAFAQIWTGAEKEEISVDLMRYLPEAPQGVMEYLLIQLLLWGKQEGYAWFNLGMAPLSGLENRALAPLWNRLGSFVFQYGEHFYNFQGLREYKEKFNPEWSPKYLAFPGGVFALPRILANISSLISGGMKGIIAK